MLHRLRNFSHFTYLHVRLLPEAGLVHSHIPTSVTLSLQAVALLGVVVSMLLWMLVATATPVSDMVSEMVRERVSPEARERLRKQAA